MKLLLYCTKAKPYLYGMYSGFESRYGYHITNDKNVYNQHGVLNGKIVAECDFEVEWYDTFWHCVSFTERKGLEKSCLTAKQLFDYVKGRNEFYAIHIKNLHIFNEFRPLRFYYQKYKNDKHLYNVEKAPQNMMYAFDVKSFNESEKKVLISIQPQWLCKILNGEKTIEVRKKVLKEML